MAAPFIPAWLDDLGLDPREFRVYCHVLRRGECWESSEEIAGHCRMNRKTVYAVLSRLEARGLLDVQHRPGRTTVYRPRLLEPQELPVPVGATGQADPSQNEPRVGVPKQATGRGNPSQNEPHPPVPKLPTEGLTREGIKYLTPPTPPQPPSRRDDGAKPVLQEPPPIPMLQPSKEQETLEHLSKFAVVPMRILSVIGPEKLADWGRGYSKEEISAAWEQAKSGATKSHRAYFEAILDGRTAFDPEILARHTGRSNTGPEELPPEQHPARQAAKQWRVGDVVSYQGQPKRVVRIDDIWLDLEDGSYIQAYLAQRWGGEPAVA